MGVQLQEAKAVISSSGLMRLEEEEVILLEVIIEKQQPIHSLEGIQQACELKQQQ